MRKCLEPALQKLSEGEIKITPFSAANSDAKSEIKINKESYIFALVNILLELLLVSFSQTRSTALKAY
jgi:hypothetical protein